MDIQLSPVAQNIISQEMSLGYGSPSEVVEQALRLLHHTSQQKVEQLQAVLIEAERSGAAIDFDLETDLDALEEEALAELAEGNLEIHPCVIAQTSA